MVVGGSVITIKVDGLEDLQSMLGDISYKMPSVLARGLTETAKDVKEQVNGWLPRLLDRPTPYTMKSLFVFPAEKNDLRAAVAFRSEVYGRQPRHFMDQVHASRSMRAQVYGGRRELKASEKRLLANGITKDGRQFLIPAKGAKIDRYGNVPGSFMNKVLYGGVKMGSASQGYEYPMNRRTQGESKYGQYFVLKKNFGHTPVGIFKNMGKKKPPMPVFLFASKADYKSRIPFEQIARAQIDRSYKQRMLESVEVVLRKYGK